MKGTGYIDDVLLVPGLGSNLMSVGQMLQNWFSLQFKILLCKVFDPNDVEIGCEIKFSTFIGKVLLQIFQK